MAVTLAGDVLAAVLLEFGEPPQDDRCVLLVDFEHETSAVKLLAGHKGGAAAAESVQHDGVCLAAILYRISEEVKGL